MLVNSRLLVRDREHFDKELMPWIRLGNREPLSYFLNNWGPFIGWPGAAYDFPGLDDPHHRYVEACAEGSCNVFLDSPAYLGWKNRKPLGPSFLRIVGSGVSSSHLFASPRSSDVSLDVQPGPAN